METISISHYALCEITAKRFVKDSQVVVFEYQSYSSGEFPDVLCYKGSGTVLYEIKVSRSDYLADGKKYSRRKWKPKVGLYFSDMNDNRAKCVAKLKAMNPELFYIEAPHLGRLRYYVCPWGMIDPKEVPDGWGLYWYRQKDGKFFKKKGSGNFRRNIHEEISILSHAFRKYASLGDQSNILISTYKL